MISYNNTVYKYDQKKKTKKKTKLLSSIDCRDKPII